MLWHYLARVDRVVDGDTLDLFIDLGFQHYQKVRVRLLGVDTPETFGVKKESEEWKAGTKARAFVEHWIATHCKVEGRDGSWCHIRSTDGKPLGQGKYGRWLVEIIDPRDSAKTLNDILVEEGHATRVVY